MKKIRSLFAFAVLTAIFTLTVLGAKVNENNGIKLNYNLTCNGENVVNVNTNDVITVVYTLENMTADEDFRISSVTNEIYFDNSFFEYVGEIEKNDCSNTAKLVEVASNDHRVYFNGSFAGQNGKFFNANQNIGSFKLKVKATSGQTVVRNRKITAYDNTGKIYLTNPTNLTVKIGTEDDELFDVVYKNGDSVFSSDKRSGTINLVGSPVAPVGSVFKGWRNEMTNTVHYPGDEFNVTENTTFVAVWEKSIVTLSFNVNGGSSISDVKKEYGFTAKLSNYVTNRTGYTFKGWYSDEDLTNKIETVTLNGDVTVYAKWEKKNTGGGGGGGGSDDKDEKEEYTLSFETNGGTAVSPVTKIEKGKEINLSGYVTQKEGFTFDGWYSDTSLTNKIEKITVNSNVTVYAKWAEPVENDKNNGHAQLPDFRPGIFTKDHIAYIVGREDGSVDPGACLTRAEAAEIFYRLLTEEVREKAKTTENNFNDVNEEDWFNTSVSTLAKLEIIKGRSVGEFAPKDNITRAELTTIIARLVDAKYEGADLFEDIDGHWANGYINISASIGWITGYEGKFRPNDDITRAEVVTLINRALKRQPESREDLLDDMFTPVDNTDESKWYYLAIQEAVNGHTFAQKADEIHEKWISLTDEKENVSAE